MPLQNQSLPHRYRWIVGSDYFIEPFLNPLGSVIFPLALAEAGVLFWLIQATSFTWCFWTFSWPLCLPLSIWFGYWRSSEEQGWGRCPTPSLQPRNKTKINSPQKAYFCSLWDREDKKKIWGSTEGRKKFIFPTKTNNEHTTQEPNSELVFVVFYIWPKILQHSNSEGPFHLTQHTSNLGLN